jgi:hypothetical protein
VADAKSLPGATRNTWAAATLSVTESLLTSDMGLLARQEVAWPPFIHSFIYHR